MSLLGIDVGTTGCKAVAFSEEGRELCAAYREYDISAPNPGWAILDSTDVWEKVKVVIREAAGTAAGEHNDPVTACSVTSMGEAMVPVTMDREILGPSIMNFDSRGGEYVRSMTEFQNDTWLYTINGNTLANNYGLTKLLWIRDNQPALYEKADKFLNWGSFVTFMLGADPVIDHSLANRSLLFDLDSADWSEELLEKSGLTGEKLPKTEPSGKRIGTVSASIASELGLSPDTAIVTGAHDQVSNALGAGVIKEGQAMYGMGSFTCIVPVFEQRRDTATMVQYGFNTEHHSVPGLFSLFIYHPAGVLVKWFRDTYAAAEHARAKAEGRDIYPDLFAEVPADPSRLMVFPAFTTLGPPDFVEDACGVIAGLYLDTGRGEILRGIIEGVNYLLLEGVQHLPEVDINVSSFIPVGGGSKSDVWIQIAADVFGVPFTRPEITEAGSLGAAILAGVGTGVFQSHKEAVSKMVRIDTTFEPDMKKHGIHRELFRRYTKLWPLTKDYLKEIARPVQ
jgi:xylulokinase